MIDKNLVLYLPFDDPAGDVAYDYSQSRADATLSGGAFLTKNAKKGKALDLNGSGECLTPQVIPFGSDFTISLYLNPTADTIGWMLTGTGVNNYLEQWLTVQSGTWMHLAFVKKGTAFIVYRNGEQVYRAIITEIPVGFSVNDHNLGGGHACIDEVKVFNVAKSQMEIMKEMSDGSDVEYYINGVNFKKFDVYVSASAGLVGRLARKETLTVDWDDYHGMVRDKKRPRYKERTISLDCFIEASNRAAYVESVNLFMSQFDKDGTQRLTVEYSGSAKTLVYEVVCLDETDPTKKWGSYNDDLMVGVFKLKLIEDEPVKKVLRHIGTTSNSQATITVTSSKLLNIYWGDGTHTFDVSGTDKVINHVYASPGEYDIVITGIIEDIQALTTNCIIVWDRLL